MLLAGLIFAAVMGAIGGFFPSRNAANRVIVEALRQV
jgi:ABC-type antimicrobial peptide transport system permease subunit